MFKKERFRICLKKMEFQNLLKIGSNYPQQRKVQLGSGKNGSKYAQRLVQTVLKKERFKLFSRKNFKICSGKKDSNYIQKWNV